MFDKDETNGKKKLLWTYVDLIIFSFAHRVWNGWGGGRRGCGCCCCCCSIPKIPNGLQTGWSKKKKQTKKPSTILKFSISPLWLRELLVTGPAVKNRVRPEDRQPVLFPACREQCAARHHISRRPPIIPEQCCAFIWHDWMLGAAARCQKKRGRRAQSRHHL